MLESQYGKGTKFIISLSLAKAPLLDVKDFVGSKHLVPATSAAEAIKLAHTETAIAAHRERRRPEDVRVLLAEDNALIREIVTRTLRGMKVSFWSASSRVGCVLTFLECSSTWMLSKMVINVSRNSKPRSTMSFSWM